MFHDHFSGHADRYAAHRPTYPAALAQWLASISPTRSLAWDCGTGSGQAAVLLGDEFDHVVATDPSARQLAHAAPHPRVEYREGRDSHSGLADSSCDLVTVAQAAHWFDLPVFYTEVRRVLRPGGVIAMWCYAHHRVDRDVDPVILWFKNDRVGRYWPPERAATDDEYRSLPFPFPRIEAPPFVISRRWTRRQLVDYVGTWSSVARAREVEQIDIVVEFERAVSVVWPNADERREVRSPIHLLVGHTLRPSAPGLRPT